MSPSRSLLIIDRERAPGAGAGPVTSWRSAAFNQLGSCLLETPLFSCLLEGSGDEREELSIRGGRGAGNIWIYGIQFIQVDGKTGLWEVASPLSLIRKEIFSPGMVLFSSSVPIFPIPALPRVLGGRERVAIPLWLFWELSWDNDKD